MKIRAMPGSAGRARSKLLKASNPPADAPIATIGNPAGTPSGMIGVSRFSFCLALFFFGFFGISAPGISFLETLRWETVHFRSRLKTGKISRLGGPVADRH